MPRTCPDCGWIWPKPVGPCPNCGSAAAPEAVAAAAAGGPGGDRRRVKMPWHLKLLVISLALYLGWRLFQGVDWLIRHL